MLLLCQRAPEMDSLLEKDVHLPVREVVVKVFERAVCDRFTEHEEANRRSKGPAEHPSGYKCSNR